MWIYCGYIYITNIHQFTAGWLIQRSFWTTAPFGIWFGMMIPTDEHIFQGVKSPTTKPLVICLMGEFLSTGMVELGIVGVSAITMNHNDGYWIYHDLLWFLQQNAGWKRWFFYPTTPWREKPGGFPWHSRRRYLRFPALPSRPPCYFYSNLTVSSLPPSWENPWESTICWSMIFPLKYQFMYRGFPIAFNERGGYVLFDGGSIYTWKSGTNTPALRNFDRKNSHYPVPLGAPIFSGNSILIVGSLYLMYLYNSWPFLSQSQHVARIEARDATSKVLFASAGVHLFTIGSPIKSTYF